MPRLLSAKELSVLDALTANNRAVLASLGGRPRRMRGLDAEEDEEERDMEEDEEERGVGGSLGRPRSRSTVRQRMGSITRQTMHKVRSNESRAGSGDGEKSVGREVGS
jgi:hypothetical protein